MMMMTYFPYNNLEGGRGHLVHHQCKLQPSEPTLSSDRPSSDRIQSVHNGNLAVITPDTEMENGLKNTIIK